jgi:hypothetical protein
MHTYVRTTVSTILPLTFSPEQMSVIHMLGQFATSNRATSANTSDR